MMLLLAIVCGLISANIYYAQPLAGPIGMSLGLSPEAMGMIVTVTQIGFGMGLLFIVPLGDLMEARRLMLSLIALAAVALTGAAMSTRPLPFLVAMVGIGIASVAVHVIVPYASHMTPEATRGREVGKIMSGVMLGIMLARPAASLVAHLSAWHVIFYISAGLMVLLALLLRMTLPRREPVSKLSYAALMGSMADLALSTRVLQRRAIYQACLFAAFSVFWTTVPLRLAGDEFHLSQGGIALFGLAGVAGAVASPIAGRLADKGWSTPATACAMLAVAIAFLLTHLGSYGSTPALVSLVAAGIVLDFGVTMNMVLGQRALFVLETKFRSRLNGLYMATFFAGGAAGSALGAWAFAHGGWHLVELVGIALPVVALGCLATAIKWPGRRPVFRS